MDEDDFRQLPGRQRGRRKEGPVGLAAAAVLEEEATGEEPPLAAVSSRPALGGDAEEGGSGGVGRVWCQLCGKDLSRLDAARRRSHANRCLDEAERLRPPSAGAVAECPLCGKGFGTLRGRGGHLKRCAARLAVPPPLLLQAVRQQSSGPGSGLPASLSGLKRKVSSATEQTTKKRKTEARMGDAEEELLVAMAMSRSLHEEEKAKARLLARGRQNREGRKNPRGEKKNHVMPPHSPPTLLLQDPERARRQTEERVALLLSEVDEFPSTPPLPPSRLLESELSRKADWPVAVPKGPPSSLWERSSLVGPSAPGLDCVVGSTLPAFLRQTDQRPVQSTALPLLGSVKAEPEEVLLQERGGCGDSREERQDAEGCSQKEARALQDLMELAGEGLTLTQWNPAAQQAEEQGQDWVPGGVPWSDLDQSPEKTQPLGSCRPPFLLGSLAAAFKGMVNNPHLSDVQFQVDSGELFYAHMFVLYARCPQLMELVDQKGFWVVEEAKTRRVLLSDVSGEAAEVFLNYLYTAQHSVPPPVLSDVAALAARFGVAELAALCTTHSSGGQPAVGASGQEEEARVDKFEELLKSMWVGEEEEDKALPPEEPGSENMVDEQELEEIYEFAATQRKAEEERSRGPEVGAYPMEEGAVPGDSSEWKGNLDMAPSGLQVWEARKETVPGLLLESPQDAEKQRSMGAAGRRPPEALPEALRELGEKSLLAMSWGESLELFQQSYDGGEPSNGEGAVLKSSTPLGLEKGLMPVSQNFSSGDSQVPLEALAGKLPASPQRRGGFCGDLSLPLFSPALQEASGRACQIKERELPKLQRVASPEMAAKCGPDNNRYAPAPFSSSSPVDLEAGPILRLDSEDDRELDQGKWPAEMKRCPSKEWVAFGAMEVDVARCQGIRAPVLSHRGSNNGQAAKLVSSSGPQAPPPGDAQDHHPTQRSAITPSPKRQSLPSLLPHNPPFPALCSSTCPPRDGKSTADVVVILDDSEEEAEAAAPWQSWGSSVLEADLPVPEDDSGHLLHVPSPEGSVATKAGSGQLSSPPRTDGTPLGGSCPAGKEPLACFGCTEEENCNSGGSRSQKLEFWDKDDETDILPLTQRLFAPVPVPKTPDLVCQEEEAPYTTPPTPMPSYSIMETPVLKKELSRFGVRTLPKKQMVLKLKEIFQYTHQRSDSRDETVSSQRGLCRGTQAAPRRPTAAAAHSTSPKRQPGCAELPQVLLAGGRSPGAGDQRQVQMSKRGHLPAGSGRRKRTAEGPIRDGQTLMAFQKAGQSGAASDASVILNSSSTEFDTSVLAAEEEEEEEDLTASQSAHREVEMLVALRQYIHSRPALRRQILFYQPFELARLQSELKQNGIRIALGRLLDFLDAHCITFTTAEARREKQQRSRHQGRRKRY